MVNMQHQLKTAGWYPVHLACRLWQKLVDVTWHVFPGTRKFLMEFGSDRATIVYHHLLNFGLPPRLEQPVTLAEKMSWLKLHHRNPLARLCTDKLTVERYVRSKGLGHLIIPCLAQADDPADIDFSRLPRQLVAKTNHGSHFNLMIHDQATLDPARFRKIFRRWLSYDFSRWFAETNYRGIRPRVLIQEMVAAPEDLWEFKFMCFHGQPRVAIMITGRRDGTPIRKAYDLDWQPIDFRSRGLLRESLNHPRPACFDQLADAAARLAEDFIHVRVDFLVKDDQVFFSELTFYNLGGFTPLEPPEMNVVAGSWVDLGRAQEYAARGKKCLNAL